MKWSKTRNAKGYVTVHSAIAGQTASRIEQRLGFSAGSLAAGYAVYALDEPVAVTQFEWRDTTRYSAGWSGDLGIRLDGSKTNWGVQRRDEMRAELGKQLGYDEKQVDAAIDKILKAALARLNVRMGTERIVKVIPAAKPGDYPDSPLVNIPQWELKAPKKFRLIDIVFGPDVIAKLSGAGWWHAHQASYPNSASIADLATGFRQKVEKFVAALTAAGAVVRPSATRRNRVRAHLMHYSFRLARGQIKAADIPPIAGCDIIWDHGVEAHSRRAAQEMVDLFQIVYLPSLRSLHIAGNAIDMTISWSGTIGMTDANRRQVEVGAPQNGAGNTVLHRIGAGYGVHKLLSDAPHWSVNGH